MDNNNTSFNQYLPINWTEGMMVGKEHLEEINQLIIGSARNALVPTICPVNYGLLPCYQDNHTSFKISGDNIPGRYFKIELDVCVAVIRSAHTIFITEGNSQHKYSKKALVYETNIQEKIKTDEEGYILIYLNIFPDENWEEVGKDDYTAIRKKKYRNIKLELSHVIIGKRTEIKQDFAGFPVALYHKNKDKDEADRIDSYFPPCINFYSYRPLLKKLDEIEGKTQDLLNKCNEIINFIGVGTQYQRQYEGLYILSTSIISSLNVIMAELETTMKYSAPIQLLRVYKQLVISLDSRKNSLNRSVIALEQINQVLNSSSTASSRIERLKVSKYNHLDIYASTLKPIIELLDSLTRVYEGLVETKLESIKIPDITSSRESNPTIEQDKKPVIEDSNPIEDNKDEPEWKRLLREKQQRNES